VIKIYPDIDDQTAALRERFSSFKLVRRNGAAAEWRGTLQPLMQSYDVSITYRVPLVVERLDLHAMQPLVRVLNPPLRGREGDREGYLPHVYITTDGDVILCLFDPETDEWTPAELLADTTIPYTIDWLACYEGWRATGRWTGGGRHPQKLLKE
jgi:hypothetical protein